MGSAPVQRTEMAVVSVRGTMRPLRIVGTMGPWCGTTSMAASMVPPVPSATRSCTMVMGTCAPRNSTVSGAPLVPGVMVSR